MKSFVHSNRRMIPALTLLLGLIATRMLWHGSLHFAFLFWNLFLAILPLFFAHIAAHSRTTLLTCLAAAGWLLFLPNSAYLLTDIIHLRIHSGNSVWLDIVILFGAGLFGVMLGLKSLSQMESWYRKFLPANAATILTILILLLNGYGIYLGRVERWNSWDIVSNPFDLLYNVAHEVRHPFRWMEVWILSSIFATGLALCYFTLHPRSES